MRVTQPVNARGIAVTKIYNCRHISRSGDNTSKADWTCTRIKIRGSIQITGIRQQEPGNRPANQNTVRSPDSHRMKHWSFGKRTPLSRLHQLHLLIYNWGIMAYLLTGKIRAHSLESRTEGASSQAFRGSPSSFFRDAVLAHLVALSSSKKLRVHSPESRTVGAPTQVLRGSPSIFFRNIVLARPVALSSSKIQSLRDKRENRAFRHHTAPMARQEQCSHCRDLQAEFDEVRAQQKALDEQVRSLEARLEEQCKIIHEKYRAEMDLFLHRVHSLHEQFSNLSNKCNHAEEKISILKFMMEKKFKYATSSSSAKPIEPNLDPEGSTARKISHIDID